MKKLFLLLALLCMVAVGCSKDEVGNIPDDAYISLNKEIVTISPDGESVGVKVYSNYAWELTNNCDWITTSITSGDASDTGVIVTLTADLTYDDREGTVVFSCGNAKKLLVVSQKLKEVIIPDANNTFNIPVEGGVAILNYQASVDCDVIIPEEAQDWITIAPASRGLSTYSTTLNIAENNSDIERSCVVKVTSQGNNELFAEYTIIQNPRCSLYYTSNDGKIVTPYMSSAFGATIISNTYKDSVGVIEFDAPITKIGDSAFRYCSSLTSVTIPDSVTTIGEGAFAWCTSLTSVTIGDSVTTIGLGAFFGCSSLTSVTIGNSVTTIGDEAFRLCSSLTSVTIPDSVTTIESYAFDYCRSLTSVTIPDSVTTIGEWAFYYCSSLTSVTIGDSVTTIGDGAFYYCSSLTSVTIGDSVTTIGNSAFKYCSSLTSITIPDSVTTIGESAFTSCFSLQAFNGKFASENSRCLIIDGVLNSFAIGCGATEYNIPDSVTTIGNGAFDYCHSLTSITIPDSVTKIGSRAFANCSSLTSVTIPDSVTEIGNYAFFSCDSLTSVYCKATTPPVALIFDFLWCAFDGNASGRKIYVPMESVEAYKSAEWWGGYESDIVGYNF